MTKSDARQSDQQAAASRQILVCSDCTREQARLTRELAAHYDDVIGCPFSQLSGVIPQASSRVLVISWARADAELRLLVTQAGSQQWPLVVMIRQLDIHDIERLPAPDGYVLLPGDSATALRVWVERAEQVRARQRKIEREFQTLNRRLEDRRLVEQAKGLLMKQHGLAEAEAYQMLRNAAMQHSQPLGQIAKNVLFRLTRG
ncbi:ANTAR domain-containing response regulator [Photobacterium sp. 1_MG-2023]|uniref:ANTAR domain-containing response regulator n=1 Tax=Photobacterium sp. 1_MG-2023 TaxID=3062646 RepID=UPI0026E3D85A|nr:ANTAR domain-containing protein [Photobacterium sp. 1_MG-2023]MDO6708306.1 ANTAR domain-containing protein [Photobacterium sp. 1_MG-2023]